MSQPAPPFPARPLVRRARDGRVSRISPGDTNKFASLVDPLKDGTPFIAVVEIFEVGGRTPRHGHSHAHEMFYVLSGEGRAVCGDEVYAFAQGDALVLPPGLDHIVENAGGERLYCLTVMVPNQDFAEMIRDGAEMALDDQDRAVLHGA